MKGKVLVVMGSDSDLPVMRSCIELLHHFQIPHQVRVCSAHRTPDATHELARTASEEGFQVIVAGAGAAAHLAGVIAASSTLPVIGVPIASSALQGVDALYSTVQMPGGIPVATMAIGKAGAKNAGILAAQILALGDPQLAASLSRHKEQLAEEAARKNQRMQDELGQHG